MIEPHAVLGLPPDCDDETIRRRYLELVRQFSPEQHPEKFAAIRAAYESLRDVTTRLRHRLFEAGRKETVDLLIEELACHSPRRRLNPPTAVTDNEPARPPTPARSIPAQNRPKTVPRNRSRQPRSSPTATPSPARARSPPDRQSTHSRGGSGVSRTSSQFSAKSPR